MRKLSIVIPTYNRTEKVVARLRELERHVSELVSITIIDNCSDTPVRHVIQEAGVNVESGRVGIIRNPCNIGLVANLVRAVEIADAEWLWVLGDDDEVARGAVDFILNEIDRCSDSVLINFTSDVLGRVDKRERPKRVIVFPDADLRELDCFANLLFISTNVVRVSTLRKYMGLIYAHASSYTHYLPAVFAALCYNRKVIVLSPGWIVRANNVPVGEARWSMKLAIHFFQLLEVIDPGESRRKMSDLIYRAHRLRPAKDYLRYVALNDEIDYAAMNALYVFTYRSRIRGIIHFMLIAMIDYLSPLLKCFITRFGRKWRDKAPTSRFIRGLRARD